MGWLNFEGETDKFYSDDVLDMLHHFIKDISSSYINTFERKITIDEFRRILELYLISTHGEDFEDYNSKIVSEVKFKLLKKNKKVKVNVGDVFSVPLSNGIFGFGRVISMKGDRNITEYFNYTSKYPIYNSEIVKKERILYSCLLLNTLVFQQWKIIYNDENFTSKDIDSLKFQVCYLGEDGYIYASEKVTEAKYDLTKREICNLPSSIPESAESIIIALEKKLTDPLSEVWLPEYAKDYP